MLTQAIIYLLSIIGIIFIAGFVVYRSRVLSYRLFGAFALMLAVWLVFQFLVDSRVPSGRLWLQLTSVVTGLLAYFFLLFASTYASSGKKIISKRLVGVSLIPVLVFTTLSFTPLLIKGVNYTPQGVEVRVGSLYATQNVFILLYIFCGLVILGRRLKKGTLEERNQIYLLIGAFAIAVLGNIVAGLLFAGNAYVQILRPLSIFIMVAMIAYGIIKHRLFDIRLVVARAVAYIGSITVLATGYGLIVFSIADYAFGLHISFKSQVFLSAATGIAGLIFQRPIKLFDKATNRIFYQDAYDPQELFDDLNRVLVSSLDLDYLLKHSSKILAENLKSEYSLIGLKGVADGHYRIAGTAQKMFKAADIERVRELTPKYHQSVIVADYLEDRYINLKELMNRNSIAVLVRLVPDIRKGEEGFGYIILGPKKSGNPYGTQDVRVLDTVANELIIAIQNALHFEEIQQFNATLQARVTDATRKLRATNTKLEALDETKDDFISMASHQLRTPLTSVKGYLSMVLEGDAGSINDTQRKMLGQAYISSQRMVYLIADLLNVSRLKTGKFVIDSTPVDLSKVIQEEISQLVETAESRSIKLTYKRPADFPVLNMDETKTRQVIMNFVDNAIYYTPSGGTIDVQLIDKGPSIELRIVDSGIGVPKAEQHHLFTKFYRARNAQKARPDGTGLGLFMAKKVIVAQGGALIFESKEGAGSTFGFSFAKSRLAATVAPTSTEPVIAANKA